MSFFTIVSYTMKRLLKDTKTMVMKIILPIGLMAILGTVLSQSFEATNLDACNVAFLNLDNGSYASDTIRTLSEEESFKNLISFVSVNSLEEAEKKCMDDEVVAALVFPEDFSQNYEKTDGKITISIYTSKYSSDSEIILDSVMGGYVNVVNTISALTGIGKGNDVSSTVFTGGAQYVKESPLSTTGKVASAVEYYAVTMLMFTLLYGIQYGINCISEDYMVTIGKRMRSTPISLLSQFGGKIVGGCLVNFIQGLVLMLVASLGFGVRWGNHLPSILFAAFSFSLFATTLGAMICMVIGEASKAEAVGTLLVPIITFISGGFQKIN